jgi:hypothetical protein
MIAGGPGCHSTAVRLAGIGTAAPGHRALGRRDLSRAVAGGGRRRSRLRLDHLVEQVARGQRDRALGRIWLGHAERYRRLRPRLFSPAGSDGSVEASGLSALGPAGTPGPIACGDPPRRSRALRLSDSWFVLFRRGNS